MKDNPIFLIGTGRCGTTLMAHCLSNHSNMECYEEIKVVQEVTSMYSRFKNQFQSYLASYNVGKQELIPLFRSFILGLFEHKISTRIVEQTPLNILSYGQLAEIFPKAKFIHMIRDGRDVACSLLTREWVNAVTGKPLPFTENIKDASQYWKELINHARKTTITNSLQDRYMEVLYEDLVLDTKKTLKEVCNFINEDYEESMIKEEIYTKSIGRWKKDMTSENRNEFLKQAGTLLLDLNYEEDNNWIYEIDE